MAGFKKRFSLCLFPPWSLPRACVNCQAGASECRLKSNLKNHIVFLAELMKRKCTASRFLSVHESKTLNNLLMSFELFLASRQKPLEKVGRGEKF